MSQNRTIFCPHASLFGHKPQSRDGCDCTLTILSLYHIIIIINDKDKHKQKHKDNDKDKEKDNDKPNQVMDATVSWAKCLRKVLCLKMPIKVKYIEQTLNIHIALFFPFIKIDSNEKYIN